MTPQFPSRIVRSLSPVHALPSNSAAGLKFGPQLHARNAARNVVRSRWPRTRSPVTSLTRGVVAAVQKPPVNAKLPPDMAPASAWPLVSPSAKPPPVLNVCPPPSMLEQSRQNRAAARGAPSVSVATAIARSTLGRIPFLGMWVLAAFHNSFSFLGFASRCCGWARRLPRRNMRRERKRGSGSVNDSCERDDFVAGECKIRRSREAPCWQGQYRSKLYKSERPSAPTRC